MKVVPKNLVALAYVADVRASMAFYQLLGFEVGNTHAPHGESEPVWAAMERGSAALMLSRSSGPIDPEQQGVLFYLYFDDIAGVHAALLEKGLAVGEMSYPFYCPKGEFRLTDPDGYCLMLTHT
jgi:hypothetical protein